MTIGDMIGLSDAMSSDVEDWPVHMYHFGAMNALSVTQVELERILAMEDEDGQQRLAAIADLIR